MISSSKNLCKEDRFRRSALTESNLFQSTAAALEWLEERGSVNQLVVDHIPFEEMREWSFEPETGDIVHRTGKFFRVHGLRVSADSGSLREWDQPIIDQPEIGILGIVAREFDGQLLFLMQAKLEPGNPAGVQLTPTVQATRSNYTQVHQGARPKYLDYFLNREKSTVLVDQLQFEQGSTFLRKRNRNIIVEVDADVPVEEDFRWFTLGQIKQLLSVPNLVSMDARTVVSCIPFRERTWQRPTNGVSRNGDGEHEGELGSFGGRLLASLGDGGRSLHSDDAIQSWLTELKCRYQLSVKRVGLRELQAWGHREHRIGHEAGRYFHVMGVRVKARNREVLNWDQPLVQPTEKGLIAFFVKEIDGVLHFLAQGKVEPGNPDVVAVGPSVHCVLSQESLSDPGSWSPFTEVALEAPPEAIRYSCIQSEEGGRFYHAENEYRVVELDPSEGERLPDGYVWVTLRQLTELLRHGLLNVEARSLLACLSLI